MIPDQALATMPANAGAAALRTFFRIAEKWGLGADESQTLLGASPSTFFRWKKTPEAAHLSHDTLERLSYVLGIYKALHIIYGEPAVADGWLRRRNDNPLFGGALPLERMLGGQVADLFLVRQHLDARRGVWT